MKYALMGFLVYMAMAQSHAGSPSKAAAYSCLSAYAVVPSVRWQELPTHEIYSQDDYKDGFTATYYIVANGKEIGYAERGEKKQFCMIGNLCSLAVLGGCVVLTLLLQN